ncbi:hypothetical protein LNQ52_00015 [Klebsiella pneumoniae subsp. pneumoniae]|nr:hypothetical protein [Klebsiella pneumoniae subsp. pneumoniae]
MLLGNDPPLLQESQGAIRGCCCPRRDLPSTLSFSIDNQHRLQAIFRLARR